MVVQDLMKTMANNLTASASVNSVFGEPRVMGRKTLIPIAAVSVGFGAGGGEGKTSPETEKPAQEGFGGGGGGGGCARPLAVIEVTEEETKIIPVIDTTKIVLASLALAGSITLMITRLLSRRGR